MVTECPGPWGPCKYQGGRSLTGESEGKIDIARGIKMPFKRLSLSEGAPLGNMEEIGLTGLCQIKG